MAVNIGPKIGIDGEAEYRRELKSIIQETKTLAAETDQAAAAFKNDATNEKKAADVTEKLNKQIEAQRKLVEKLEDAVKKSTEQTGENSTETLKWKEQLAKAKTGLANLEGQTKDTTTEVKDLGAAEDATGEKTSVFGDVLKANLAGDAIKKGLEITKKIVQELGEFFIEAVKSAAEYADEINTLNSTTGLGTDTLQEYKYMAALLDVDLETITGSMTKMEKAMSTDAKAFEELGVATRDENGNLRDANAVFEETLQALSKIENPVERDTTAMEIFGKSAKELNPLIETSASDLNALRKEAHDVGAVLDKDTLSGLNDVNDALDRVGLTWDTVKNKFAAKIGEKILPELQEIVDLIQELAETGNVDRLFEKVLDKAVKLIEKLPVVVSKALPKALSSIGNILGRLIGNTPALVKAGVELAKVLLRGLITGIPDMAQALGDAFKKSQLSQNAQDAINHLEDVRRKIAEIPGAVDRMNSSLSEIDGKQKEAEHWIQIFDDLSKKTNPTAEDTQKLLQAVDRLNTLYPELGLAIDEESGKWNQNTKEIRDNIDAISARYKAEAYYAAASDTMADIARLELERKKQQEIAATLEKQVGAKKTIVNSAKTELDTLTKLLTSYNNLETRDEAAFQKGIGELGLKDYAEAEKRWADLVEVVNQGEAELYDLETEFDAASDAVEAYDAEIDVLTDDLEWFYEKAAESEEQYFKNQRHKQYLDSLTKALSDGTGKVRSKAEAVGIALGQGVEAGLQAEAHNVYAKAEAIVKQSIIAMKNVAKIASPSKVTENLIGKNLALGIIKGWDDVMSPAKLSTAFSMTPAFEAMTSSITNTTTTNTTNLGGVSVNVYPTAGTNIDALTDLIMIKMQRAVNKRKAVFSNELHVQ